MLTMNLSQNPSSVNIEMDASTLGDECALDTRQIADVVHPNVTISLTVFHFKMYKQQAAMWPVQSCEK